MLVLDVNVIVAAHHREAKDHEKVKEWLKGVIDSGQPFGFPEFVLFNFVRVVTLPRPWKRPSETPEALLFCDQLRRVSRCELMQPSERHWSMFDDLCRAVGLKGNLINDAYLATFALDRGGEMITDDQDFVKFPGLRWRGPLETHVRTNPR